MAFDTPEIASSVDKMKSESKMKPIDREDYIKKLLEIKTQEELEDPEKNTADDDLAKALEWAEMNDTEKLEHTLDNSYVLTSTWPNTAFINPAQKISKKTTEYTTPEQPGIEISQ